RRRRHRAKARKAPNPQQDVQEDANRSNEMPGKMLSIFHGLHASRADFASLPETAPREHHRMQFTVLANR
ncbi:MAG: hypothetical protein Q7U92_17885, partial [Bradyrhizobium sp.]|nr:hypothetical protein [Bradyrhizobium sp.]